MYARFLVECNVQGVHFVVLRLLMCTVSFSRHLGGDLSSLQRDMTFIGTLLFLAVQVQTYI